jgi:hypothetical protein
MFHVNLVVFNEKINFCISLVYRSFSPSLVSSDMGDSSLFIYASLQMRLFSSVHALHFHGSSALPCPVLVSPRANGIFPLLTECVGEERQRRPTSVLRCITGSVFSVRFFLTVVVH